MTGLAERTTIRLQSVAAPRVWRTVTATLCAALTLACFHAGLSAYAPAVQAGLVGGLVVALIAPALAEAAIAALLAALLGIALAPYNAWQATEAASVFSAVVTVAMCALGSGLGLKVALERRLVKPSILTWLAVAVVLANLWVTVVSANSTSTYDPTTGVQSPSFNSQLVTGDFGPLATSDDAWFYRVSREVRDGQHFYPAFARALEENPRWAPTTVTAFRMPTLFVALAAVPNPAWVPYVFLGLGSLCIVAVVFVTKVSVRVPLAIPGCAAVASYLAYFPIQLPVFSQESWAAMFGILALSAAALSRRGERWRLWLAAAVALAVAGACVRETLAFVVFAGVVSAFFEPSERRRFALIAWGSGAGLFAAAYAAHAVAVEPYLRTGTSALARGSVGFALAAFNYGTDLLGYPGPLPVLLALLGILGALLVPNLPLRLLTAGAVLLPLCAFVIVGNRAWYETTGDIINYWGATLVPLAYAMVPTAFVLLPESRPAASSERSRRAKPQLRRAG